MAQWAFNRDRFVQSCWYSPPDDPQRLEDAALADLANGARYGHILKAMRALSACGVGAGRLAVQARTKWPDSIDIALFAFELSPRGPSGDALDHLQRCVLRQNRRRAILARAWLRAGYPDRARAVLAEIDPTSPTAAEDMMYRAELALKQADFKAAKADIDWLSAHGKAAEAAALDLRRAYRQEGATAVSDWLAQPGTRPARALAQAFEIAISENDFTLAPEALALWGTAEGANATALDRARTRLALERGEGERARALLEARLDTARPWEWGAIDHLQWLRAGQILQSDPAALLEHARRAARVHARHDWLFHLTLGLRESVEDWAGLTFAVPDTREAPERHLSVARALLRQGLPARALGMLATALRARPTAPEALRLHLLRSDAFAQAGRMDAAQGALERAKALAADRVQRAECALQDAELSLTHADPASAAKTLQSVSAAFPSRMVVPLTETRIAFLRGDFAAATAANARFTALKSQQIGQMPAPDLRDRIVEDACSAAHDDAPAFRAEVPVSQTVAASGAERIAQSPGLSALLLLRSNAQGSLEFHLGPDRQIPRKIAHYWQGPASPAIARAQAQWARLHPGFEQRVFDEITAAAWLGGAYGPAMAERFERLQQPAACADFFRVAWLLREGGIFADLDEYPRVAVTEWLAGAGAVLCIERGFGSIANNFVAATPGHGVSAQALENISAALEATEQPYAWWHTGPAQWTRAAFAQYFIAGARDIRFLSQAQYCRRVSTNLPYPHKRSPDHWR